MLRKGVMRLGVIVDLVLQYLQAQNAANQNPPPTETLGNRA